MKKISEEKRNLILSGNMLTVIWTLAVPIVINSFIQTMYNLTDTFWISNLGADEMAAITVVTPIQNVILNFGAGITTAGAVLISQYLGARKDKEANSMARHIYLCSMIFAVVCATLCFMATPAILSWMGAEGDVAQMGATYLRIVLLDMPLLYTINMYQAVHQSQGDTVRPMLLNLVGVVINLVLDPLLIVVFKMGVGGAAIATFAAKIPGAIIALRSLTRKGRLITINYKDFKWDSEKFRNILKVGLPTAIGGSTMQFGFVLMSKNVLKYGSMATAAYGIGNKINGLITLPSNGVGSAVATIVGQNVGAGQKERAEKGYRMAMWIAVIFLFLAGRILSMRAVAEPIVRIFGNDPETVRMATDFLCLMAAWCFTNGVYNATISLFQGSGHTMITMAVDASRLWVFRFLTLYIGEEILHLGVESIWWSVVLSNAISAAIMYVLYRLGIWKKDVVKINRSEGGSGGKEPETDKNSKEQGNPVRGEYGEEIKSAVIPAAGR